MARMTLEVPPEAAEPVLGVLLDMYRVRRDAPDPPGFRRERLVELTRAIVQLDPGHAPLRPLPVTAAAPLLAEALALAAADVGERVAGDCRELTDPSASAAPARRRIAVLTTLIDLRDSARRRD
jgi:hypothetical protein